MNNIEYYKNRKVVEPSIIQETRDLIKQSFIGLKFVEDSHQYFVYQDKKKIEYSCVSNLVHQFQRSRDWEQIAFDFAKKNKLDKAEVQKKWKLKSLIKSNIGTRVHSFSQSLFYMYFGREDLIVDQSKYQYGGGYLLPHCKKEEASIKFWEELDKKKTIFPVLAEVKVFSRDLLYSGTLDLLTYDSVRDGFIINDYKTNETLFKDYKTPLLPPFQMYNEEDYSLYILQLSLYQICLENIGIKIVDRNLIHFLDNGDFKEYSLPDETKALRESLNMTISKRVNFDEFSGFEYK